MRPVVAAAIFFVPLCSWSAALLDAAPPAPPTARVAATQPATQPSEPAPLSLRLPLATRFAVDMTVVARASLNSQPVDVTFLDIRMELLAQPAPPDNGRRMIELKPRSLRVNIARNGVAATDDRLEAFKQNLSAFSILVPLTPEGDVVAADARLQAQDVNEYLLLLRDALFPPLPLDNLAPGEIWALPSPATPPPPGRNPELSTGVMPTRGLYAALLPLPQLVTNAKPAPTPAPVSKFTYNAGNTLDSVELIAYYNRENRTLEEVHLRRWGLVQADANAVEAVKCCRIRQLR